MAMFTTVTRPFASVYAVATEYCVADARSKSEDLDQFIDRLRATVTRWSAAEHSTTDLFTPR
jgi:hypothetical protein